MAKTPRKNKYTPNLAAFYFRPDLDWSIAEAQTLYQHQTFENINKVIFGDCIPGMKKIPSESIDLIIADPPFGLKFTGKEAVYNRNSHLVVDGYSDINPTDYTAFSHQWIAELPRILKKHGSAYIFSGWTNLFAILQAIQAHGLVLCNDVVWVYNFPLFTKKKFASSHYHILHVVKHEKKVFFNRIQHYETDVWTIPRTNAPGQAKNGTKLPLEVVRKCINFSSKPGDLILDPFVGNATTLIATKGEFRHFVGFEINQKLKPVITKHLKKIHPGELYTPYTARLPTIAELQQKYPRAYQHYLRIQNQKE